MKRLGIGALWVVTIAATWMIVRGTASRDAQPAASTATRQREHPTRSAMPRLPALPQAPRAPTAATETDPAFQQALATLERDMSDGRWSLADRDRLGTAIARLEAHQTRQLLERLFPKLNSGAVTYEYDGSPI